MPTTQPRGGQILDNTVKLDTPNQDITGVLPAANGGTGNATNALNSVLLGNGTGALQTVAPGTTGNVLKSNGTTWQSVANAVPPATTKGDLDGFSTVNARLPAGADGQILVVDSGQALGLAYQNVNFQHRRAMQYNSVPGGTTVQAFGMAAPTITSGIAATNADDVTAPFVQISTTAVAANVASIATAFTQLRRDWQYDVSFDIKTTAQALTTGRHWIGVFSASPGASDTPLIHIAGFRFISSGAAGSPNWRAITAAGTATQTNVDTGVVVAVSTNYVLRIISTGSAINFYINGKFVGTSTTNLPTATQLCGFGIFTDALSAVASTLKLDWCGAMV